MIKHCIVPLCAMCVLSLTAAAGAEFQPMEAPPRPLAPEPNPYTIEPGRFAIEVDAVNYTRDRRDGITTTALEWPVTLRVGILHNFEFQVQVETFVWERARNQETETNSGFGNVYLRPKVNIWGNDREIEGGRTAFAVMPFLKLPTETHGLGNNVIEGGIMFPFDVDLVDRLILEITPEIGIFRDDPDRRTGYHPEAAALFSLNYEATEIITVFGEFFAAVSAESGSPWIGVVAAGVTFDLDPHTVIEPAVALGVTREADDYNFALTLVRRF